MRLPLLAALCCALALGTGLAVAATPATPPSPPVDPAALRQLIDVISLDVMSEASVEACEDVGAASFEQVRAAWASWRERHQLAPLRRVVKALNERMRRKEPTWEEITEPMRQRVLNDPAPDATCAALARDYTGPAMDASALYPRAGEAMAALVQAGVIAAPVVPPVVEVPPRGQFIVPGQVEALYRQHGNGWNFISPVEAEKRLGHVYVKGRVKRGASEVFAFILTQEQGDRVINTTVYLRNDAEAWVGREVVLRGLVTTLNSYSMTLVGVALVTDTSGLVPSPLPLERWSRKPVILRRVLSPPGKGLADKDIAAVVIHGKADYNNGSSWEEDVRFLLRDGSIYNRTSMPPDQLNVAASRQLEPQQWGRWRQGDIGYEMQHNDPDGGPSSDWTRLQHHAVRPWPQDTRLEGRYTNASFSGSLMLGGVSSKQSFVFTRDGRFETSYSSFAGSGGMAAANGAAISSSYHADSKGTVSAAGGTVAGPGGTAGAATSAQTQTEGADRRGRYRLSGYTLVLDFDNGHQQRLLSFPTHAQDNNAVYVGSVSYLREK